VLPSPFRATNFPLGNSHAVKNVVPGRPKIGGFAADFPGKRRLFVKIAQVYENSLFYWLFALPLTARQTLG